MKIGTLILIINLTVCTWVGKDVLTGSLGDGRPLLSFKVKHKLMCLGDCQNFMFLTSAFNNLFLSHFSVVVLSMYLIVNVLDIEFYVFFRFQRIIH